MYIQGHLYIRLFLLKLKINYKKRVCVKNPKDIRLKKCRKKNFEI